MVERNRLYLCAIGVALSLTLFSCTTSDAQEAAPAEIVPVETFLGEGSEEQRTYISLFSNMRMRDIQEIQGFFNVINKLTRDDDGERMYLAGYGDALLSNCYESAYHTLVTTFSQEAVEEVMGKTLCAAFAREGEARTAFIEQVRSNLVTPSLMNSRSEFHALMPKVQEAYQELFHFNVYTICIDRSEEDTAQYCEALEKYAVLLEEATELLRADED